MAIISLWKNQKFFVRQIVAAGIIFLTILNSSFASIENSPLTGEEENDGTVEVQYSADTLAPFSQRKSNFSTTFGINVEQVYPEDYISGIDGNKYETLFGTSTIDIVQGRLGLKYNTSAGGIEVGILGGYGEISDGRIAVLTGTDTDAKLEVTKLGAYGSYVMDSLFSEPYLAPYIEGQLYSYDWLESAKSGEEAKGNTAISYGFSIGALFQLNWLDPSNAFIARESFGLNNTYVDLFVSYYTKGDGDDPDFSSNTNLGFGLKFEF